jgi:hydrocephalus-inducing protein
MTSSEYLRAQSEPETSIRILELLDVAEQSFQRDFAVDIDRPLFQPSPSLIRFQAFHPAETISVPLKFRNLDIVARRLSVFPSQSPYFQIIEPANLPAKIAPGMEVTYVIEFRPDAAKDYSFDIVCTTEREKFVVPVRCIGPRAVLDFPDEVRFSTIPVKSTSERVILVRNVGDRTAQIQMSTSTPFFTSCQNLQLDSDESVQIALTYAPNRAGCDESFLTVEYDTGELVRVGLIGFSEESNVRLERSTLRFESAYLGVSTQRTLRVFNRSDVRAQFKWTAFATPFEDQSNRSHVIDILDQAQSQAEQEFEALLAADPTVRNQLALLKRTMQHKQLDVDTDQLLFSDNVFSIEPLTGDIWPNSVRYCWLYFVFHSCLSSSMHTSRALACLRRHCLGITPSKFALNYALGN